MNRRLLLLAPLGVVAAGGGAFWAMLSRMQAGRFDPHDIGNPMLGKPMPDFALPGFSSADVRAAAQARPVLLNFFASWCIPCAAEADVLAQVAGAGVPLWGVSYKDTDAKRAAFLAQYGNPYGRIAIDSAGRTFIDFGAYGVPETYLIDRRGVIAWHLAGPLTPEVADGGLMTALKASA